MAEQKQCKKHRRLKGLGLRKERRRVHGNRRQAQKRMGMGTSTYAEYRYNVFSGMYTV